MLQTNLTGNLASWRHALLDDRQRYRATISLCGGTGCKVSRAQPVIDAVRRELAKRRLGKKVRLRITGCHGFCEQGPLMIIEPGNTFYCHVTPDDAPEIVAKTIREGEVLERLLYTDPVSGERIRTESEIPFYRGQNRHLLSQNSQVDPCSIEDFSRMRYYRRASFPDSGNLQHQNYPRNRESCRDYRCDAPLVH